MIHKKIFTVLCLCFVLACSASSGVRSTVFKPTVILISIDGFRADYFEKYEAPHLKALAARGVRAKHMLPVFPSITFPSHYSMVTGLHPEHHGILSNSMSDSVLGRFTLSDRKAVENPQWWGGEPIWVTAQKQGQKSGTMFWVGSEAKVAGQSPTYFLKYNAGLSYSRRVQKLLSWLDLPDADRPTLLTLYFEAVDKAGHVFGPDTDEVKSAILKVDHALGELLSGLETRKMTDKVSLIVVSDHGMAKVGEGQQIYLEDYISLKGLKTPVSGATLVGLSPKTSTQADAVYTKLKNAHPHLKVYRKAEIPARWHFQNHPRIPEIVAFADEGWMVAARKGFKDMIAPRGMHGYDNALPSMAALFVAAGPAFKNGIQVEPFLNIHVYPLVARLLSVKPAPNDAVDFTPEKLGLK